MRRTKIVATIGPSSSGETVIEAMIDKGMDVARLNFSHGTHKDHEEKIISGTLHALWETHRQRKYNREFGNKIGNKRCCQQKIAKMGQVVYHPPNPYLKEGIR